MTSIAPGVRRALVDVATRHGTPAYVYDLAEIERRVARVRAVFDDLFEISYAVKANPNRELVARLRHVVDRLDLSSGGELAVAARAGWEPGRWSFVGPAKSTAELQLAVETGCGHVVAESLGEVMELSEIARERRAVVPVVLRVNPVDLPKGFGVSMARRATIFGIDEEEIDDTIDRVVALEAIELVGFHVYAGTQCLDADAVAENLGNIARLYGRLVRDHRLDVRHLIFGSGFGIPYHPGAEDLDLEAVAGGSLPTLRELRSQLGDGVTFALEMGRYLVGPAGWYVAAIRRVKRTRGSVIVALDGGMHHHLAASGNLGGVLKRNYPIFSLTGTGEPCTVDLAGPLCTNIDILGRGVELPSPQPGDLVAIGASGAYGPSTSPLGFISHPPPLELLAEDLSSTTAVTDVTAAGPGGSIGTPVARTPGDR